MFYIIMFSLVWVVFRIVFLFKVEGKEVINAYKKNGRPFIICANHLSMLDPIFIVIARGIGPKLTIMGKAELFKKPVFAWMFRQVGVIPVDRGAGDKSVIEKAIADVKNGRGLLIFPEGTRGEGNQMLKMKSGAFMVAAQGEADIIPCRLIYPNKTQKLKFFHTVVVSFGKPLTIEETKLNSGSREQIRVAKSMLTTSFETLLEEYNEHHRS